MTYGELSLAAAALYGQYVTKFVNATSGSPTELAILLRMVHNRIAAYPCEFEFLKETGTITMNGASSYNLRTLFPDFRSLYQLFNVNQNQEHPFVPNYEANVIPADSYSIRGTTLYFAGTLPASGTPGIQYKSQWLVKNAAGVRQRDFLAEDDVSVLDDADTNVLLFGLGDYVQWKADVKSQDRKLQVAAWFKEAFDNMTSQNVMSHQLTSMLG